MEVYIEHADGHFWTISADDLEDAQQIIENEAIAVRENCPDEETETIFPLYWSIKDEQKEMIASGHVNEYGEMYS